ncbi:MAG: sodium-dependent transporter [Oscillospiraceae bacterium]|nr:sodium-dependent transporter [Oscillospiraceae bacterium]
MKEKARGSFASNIGFVLAAAGSAVGLGNLWRFPYLAAKDGGGLFLLIYILASLTFGFALMTTEIAIGRKTRTTPLQAYSRFDGRFRFLGVLATAVPVLIFPYYCVIGGWVTKYASVYLTGQSGSIYAAGADGFFTGFITGQLSPVVWFLVFMALTALIVLMGVEKGIEKASKIMMPVLLVLIVGIAVFSLTLKHTDPATGETRTALEGLKIYLVPNFDGITPGKFISILLDAISQMFYSMSLAMGIMITYGSYCRRESDLLSSVNQIEFFDTGVALIAGLIIVPTVFTFQGTEGLSAAGPSLMFVSLPLVFEQMGSVGSVVGALFFLLVLFAALTSSISIMETVAASLIDRFGIKRSSATVAAFALSVVIGLVVCLGYNVLYADIRLPNGTVGQLLDVLDYLTNNLMLPVVALLTCVLIGWLCGPGVVLDEVRSSLGGKKFRREKLYSVMIRFVAPVLLAVILLQAFNFFSFLE